MRAEWVEDALNRLATLHEEGKGWPYQAGNLAAAEPTVLASFALAANQAANYSYLIEDAAHWLASIQLDDGSVGIGDELALPSWSTPYAILLWSHVDLYGPNLKKAVDFLLKREGRTFPQSPIFGHDLTLAGWPWVVGTHSWLEPSVLSILALARQGYSGHPRVEEAIRLIEDRSLPSGGWNYGNTVVFGKELRPQPGPTGLALLALASVHSNVAPVHRGSKYLIQALPRNRSPRALGWGLLGLSAWGKELEQANQLLEECYKEISINLTPMDLALLTLAAGNESTRFFL